MGAPVAKRQKGAVNTEPATPPVGWPNPPMLPEWLACIGLLFKYRVDDNQPRVVSFELLQQITTGLSLQQYDGVEISTAQMDTVSGRQAEWMRYALASLLAAFDDDPVALAPGRKMFSTGALAKHVTEYWANVRRCLNGAKEQDRRRGLFATPPTPAPTRVEDDTLTLLTSAVMDAIAAAEDPRNDKDLQAAMEAFMQLLILVIDKYVNHRGVPELLVMALTMYNKADLPELRLFVEEGPSETDMAIVQLSAGLQRMKDFFYDMRSDTVCKSEALRRLRLQLRLQSEDTWSTPVNP